MAETPRTSAAQPLPLDPFTMATRMCDDDGMVSETVAEDMQGLANQELRRLTYLDKVNNMRRHGGSSSVGPFACTGSAHLAGEHIRCTSPAHGKQPDYDQQSGGQVSDEPTITAAVRPAPDIDGLRNSDTWDGYYFRDEHGRALTLCHETGRNRPYIVCGHPVPGGVYCGHEGRREECPSHAR